MRQILITDEAYSEMEWYTADCDNKIMVGGTLLTEGPHAGMWLVDIDEEVFRALEMSRASPSDAIMACIELYKRMKGGSDEATKV